MAGAFKPEMVNLAEAAESDDMMRQIICFLSAAKNEYDGSLGLRISSIFVIGIVPTIATFFPVIAARATWVRIPLYVYLFARYFGAGVIVATAFIHLLDPAYSAIGPDTCVGRTGGWAEYSWVPAIALASVVFMFLVDLGAERYVETKYGLPHGQVDLQNAIATNPEARAREASHAAQTSQHAESHTPHQFLHSGHQGEGLNAVAKEQDLARNGSVSNKELANGSEADERASIHSTDSDIVTRQFATQIAAFFILEFGVIFHSVVIGLNLGTAARDEFSTLYIVLVFHQSFEGLGIGARLSAIPFPRRLGRWMPWALCAAYGLTTPIAIAVGLGLKTTYNSGSFKANVLSGVLDSLSAGILLFTGLVELLARDFLFDPARTKNNKRLTFMVLSVMLGILLMALLGKWA